MYFPKSLSVTLVLFFVLTLSACGSSSGKSTGPGNGGVDTTAPTAVVQPANGSLIQNTSIVILFDESMDSNPVNYSITGTMAGESDGGVWSQTTVVADTLTILPTGGNWALNTNRTLVVNANDLAGNPVSTISLLYDVVALSGTIYYVSSTALNDAGTGLTPATAKRNIYAAYAAASNPATVVVNGGVYPVNSDNASTRIELKDGVSLFGGFSVDFTNRDTAVYISAISDSATIGTGGAISGNSAVSVATVIEGFTMNSTMAVGASATSINLSSGASPTIRNNIINSGAGGSSTSIYIVDAAPVIENNIIMAGTGSNTKGISHWGVSSPIVKNNFIHGGTGINSSGISGFNTSSAFISGNIINGGTGTNTGASNGISSQGNDVIENNIIFGGSNFNITWGIILLGPSKIIRNNTIHSGTGRNTAYSVYLNSATATELQNNILYTYAATTSICIYKQGGSFNTVQNNNLFGCNIPYNDNLFGCPGNADNDNNASTCTLAEMEALMDIPGGVSGNVAADPMFADIDGTDNDIATMADNDWHFGVGSPASVTASGLNGLDQMPAWSFTVDKDGVTRPASGTPWAIGAYEP